MQLPKLLGKIIYIVGKPIQILILMNSKRAYIVLVHEDSILVTKNWLGTHKTWRLPGGGLHRGEQPLDGALREVIEEVGVTLQPSDAQALHSEPFRAKGRFWFWLFVVHVKEKPNITINTKELIAAEWIPIEELQKLIVSNELELAMRYL